jgi:alpha-glucoside transport system substrate-binding protein
VLVAVAVVQRSRAEEQTAAAQAATEQVRARQLASTSVATRRVDPDLSILLALRAIDIARRTEDEVPGELVEALHWALQAKRVPFPADAPVAALPGPDGPRGVFLLPLEELVALADRHVVRELSARECRLYLGSAPCPELSRDWGSVPAADPEPLSTDPERPLAGTRVTLAAALGAVQQAGLEAELDRIHERTGIQIELGRPEEEALTRQVAEGRPPDVASVPQPALLHALAADGGAIDMGGYLDVGRTRQAIAPHLLALGTAEEDGTWPAADGRLYGIPLRLSNKSTVWHSVPAFERAGYEVPQTYEELVALTDRMVRDGHTPWCHGEGSGAASGWPGTDLIENLLLHDSLADYDAWLARDLEFSSPPVRRAFDRMGRLLLEPDHLAAGQSTAATLDFVASLGPLLDDPPGCLLYPQGSDAQAWLPFGAETGRDVAVFPFPPVSPGGSPMVLGGGDFLVAFHDRPEVREVVSTVLREDFGRAWARSDASFLSPRMDFPSTAYVRCGASCQPDPIRTALAPVLTDALEHDRFRFDGSDLLPYGVGLEPFWSTMVQFVGEGPGNLDRLLGELDETWDALEAEASGRSVAADRAGLR